MKSCFYPAIFLTLLYQGIKPVCDSKQLKIKVKLTA